MFIMAIVWGILLFYFLTPFKTKPATMSSDTINFSTALKQSIVSVTFHKKAVLGFSLVILTLLAVWWSQRQNVINAELHALKIENQPPYVIAIFMYSLFIYALVIERYARKLQSNNS